jgi:hypothetical protein
MRWGTNLACDYEVRFVLHRGLEQSSIILNEVKVDGGLPTRPLAILYRRLGSQLGTAHERDSSFQLTGCILTSHPSLDGPSCMRSKPSFASTPSLTAICWKRSSSAVPSSSRSGAGPSRGALEADKEEPPRPRPRPRKFPREDEPREDEPREGPPRPRARLETRPNVPRPIRYKY